MAIVPSVLLATLASSEDACPCLFQGSYLPDRWLAAYDPSADQSNVSNITLGVEAPLLYLYGTMCAAWDSMPGMPYEQDCLESDRGSLDTNFCQAPWCYVSPDCATEAHVSQIFSGSEAKYSYFSCGKAPNCKREANGAWGAGCPYDPAGDESYTVYKKSCECVYAGQEVEPYGVYGTTCAAWDTHADSPNFVQDCSKAVDMCSRQSNYCQVPWCYVQNATCDTAIPSKVTPGMFYSYDTCLGGPNCEAPQTPLADRMCPYDARKVGWSTPEPVCETFAGEENCPVFQDGNFCPRLPSEEALRSAGTGIFYLFGIACFGFCGYKALETDDGEDSGEDDSGDDSEEEEKEEKK